MKQENLEIPHFQIETVVNVVAQHLGICAEDIVGKNRTAQVVKARYIAIYFSTEYTAKKLSSIGEYFGGRKAGSVSNSLKAFRDIVSHDSNFSMLVEQIKVQICSIKSDVIKKPIKVFSMSQIPSHDVLANNLGIRPQDVLRRI